MKIVTVMSLVASLAVSSAFSMEWAFEVYKKVSSFTASRTEVSVPSAESLGKKLPPLNGKGCNTYTGGYIVREGILKLCSDGGMEKLIVEKNGIVDLNGFDLEVGYYKIEGELINTGHRNASFIYPSGRITVTTPIIKTRERGDNSLSQFKRVAPLKMKTD